MLTKDEAQHQNAMLAAQMASAAYIGDGWEDPVPNYPRFEHPFTLGRYRYPDGRETLLFRCAQCGQVRHHDPSMEHTVWVERGACPAQFERPVEKLRELDGEDRLRLSQVEREAQHFRTLRRALKAYFDGMAAPGTGPFDSMAYLAVLMGAYNETGTEWRKGQEETP